MKVNIENGSNFLSYSLAPIPTRVGKKKRVKGPDTVNKLPTVTPYTKCRLRLLKSERIKDFLLMEEEYIKVSNALLL